MSKDRPFYLICGFCQSGAGYRQISTADYVHVDVMDGEFVPNITIGIPVVKSIRPTTSLPLDVHLIIVRPGRYVEQFCDAGADLVTLHVDRIRRRPSTMPSAASTQRGRRPVSSSSPPLPPRRPCPSWRKWT